MLRTFSTFDEILRRDRRSVAKGTIFKAEGENSHARYYVAEGWLAASKSLEDGEQHILDFILPGETYDPTGTDDRTSFVQLEALCDAVVVPIDMTTWARLLQDHPDLRDIERSHDIAARARQSERMLRLGKANAETRIAYVLIELCIRASGNDVEFNEEFHVPLAQQQLGDFAGLSSVHVCRTLRRLNRIGVIWTGDHMDITIRDLPALASLAQVDLAELGKGITAGAA